MLTPLEPVQEPEPSAVLQTMFIVGSDGLAKNTGRLPAPSQKPPPGLPTDQLYPTMCDTTAALLGASAGADESAMLNGPPLNGCQHDGCELELICESGHEVAAPASPGAVSTPTSASAAAAMSATDMA